MSAPPYEEGAYHHETERVGETAAERVGETAATMCQPEKDNIAHARGSAEARSMLHAERTVVERRNEFMAAEIENRRRLKYLHLQLTNFNLQARGPNIDAALECPPVAA